MEQFHKGLVSIIIPVFNRASLLPETLDSIVSQTYVNWECIIVDDGSTDPSLNVAMEYAMYDNRFKVYSRPWYYKKGANSCRNYGFKLSKGEFIQWFDSDDLMMTEMIKNKIVAFKSFNSDIVVCGAGFFSSSLPNSSLDELKVSLEPKTNNPAFEYFAGDFWFGTPQAMLKRIIVSNLPYIFNERLKRNQETELFVRCLLYDFKFYYLNRADILVRQHNSSISSNYLILSESKRLELDLAAYVSMFMEFKKRKKINPEIHKYFSEYFLRSLKKITHNRFLILKLYILGMILNMFPSRKLSSKIFLYRILKNV
jgi:glycosyltransferase involved in cell wall biosynthesis